MSLVLDSSVALAWCLKSEHTPELLYLLEDVRRQLISVPAIWTIEVTNVLATALRTGRIEQIDFFEATILLSSLNIEIRPARQPFEIDLIASVMKTANLTAYDAEYLSLSQHLNVPLATLDKQLRHAASASGVPLLL